jgi:PAB1-binding protein PBP1
MVRRAPSNLPSNGLLIRVHPWLTQFSIAGNAQTFRTDTAISGSARPAERPLQRFVFDADLDGDMSLEAPSNQRGTWDQFAVAEQRGLTTDYDENIYTTRINRDDPDYKRRAELAERKAREIESSAAMTSHVAEERRADYKAAGAAGNADDQGDEEERYVV